jgi:hypothetical protein
VHEPGTPFLVFSVTVSFSAAQHFDGLHHADDFLLTHLHRAREGMVRGAVHKSGIDEVFAAQ